MSLPMTGSTSLNETRASAVGEDSSGSVARKRRKVAEGWRSAEERKAWSWRRKETRLSGEPARRGQHMPVGCTTFYYTGEVVRNLLPKLAAQHRIYVRVRGLREGGLGERGHSPRISELYVQRD